MGERKGQNKYYPPDFDHNKHFSLNSYHGVHALRERGAKAHEGILIIRFEMPFNCWCLTCNKPIGMGVRYNSEKTKVGNFYSTPIYRFKMGCHLCAGDIIIQTDPEHFQYVIVSGARRREQRYDAGEVGLPELADAHTRNKIASDPMFQLEHASKDEEAVRTAERPSLKKMVKIGSNFLDDYGLNQMARRQFRAEKKIALEKQKRLDALSQKLSLSGSDVKLLPASERDTEAAKFHIRNCGIDASDAAVERRKNQLVRNLKTKVVRKSASRFSPFAKGFSRSRGLLKASVNRCQTRPVESPPLQASSLSLSTSLVSADYGSSDESETVPHDDG